MNLEQNEKIIIPLNTSLDNLVEKFNFGKDYKIVRVDDREKYFLVRDSGLGMDIRTKFEKNDNRPTVFEGLAFDPENIRTQAYYLENDGKPVAVITFAITPEKYIVEEKYFKKEGDKVEVCDFKSLTGEVPKFTISPAWTKVDEEHRTKFALPGFKMIKEVLENLESCAPEGSWIEAVAQGKGKFKDLLKNKNLGDYISKEELPFDINDIGLPREDSVSTAKMAKLLKIPQFSDVGSYTLGPVFAQKIVNNKE